jgi:hypothetical protein
MTTRCGVLAMSGQTSKINLLGIRRQKWTRGWQPNKQGGPSLIIDCSYNLNRNLHAHRGQGDEPASAVTGNHCGSLVLRVSGRAFSALMY